MTKDWADEEAARLYEIVNYAGKEAAKLLALAQALRKARADGLASGRSNAKEFMLRYRALADYMSERLEGFEDECAKAEAADLAIEMGDALARYELLTFEERAKLKAALEAKP